MGLASTAFALGPHEVLLLANRHSPRSLEIAREYAALRNVPGVNLVELDLPENPALEMTPDEFTKTIWAPACLAIRERGIGDHILAWIYSVDFPIRITSTPALSLHGITFLKGRLPEKEWTEKGTYASPLFAGPGAGQTHGFPAQSLDVLNAWLGQDMPVPSMMLGYMGPNGNTREEIMACLRAGVKSDRTWPDGTITLVTNNDVRTLCRTWEFAPVIRDLKAQGIATVITNAFPSNPDGQIGLMSGIADVPGISTRPFNFLPGAIAEHLTSFGAVFDSNSQTKITEWIRAGATASAGTVVEPRSIWMKFPHARVFSLQAAGCTILESLTQSIRCPLQILLLGEPLASPWSPLSTLVIRGLEDGSFAKRKPVTAVIQSRRNEVFNRFMFLLDGRTLQAVGNNPETILDPATLTQGPHTLRVVAYKVGSVRSQIFAETSFEVKVKVP
ncbi:MAG: TIGR03790 family protein [bacterium]